MSSWAIATTAPRCEEPASERLSKVAIRCFYPRIRKRVVVRGRYVETTPPLYPGYVFVQPGGKWRSLMGTPGIVGVLMSSGFPADVSSQVVEAIRSRCDRDGICPDDPFVIGEKVRIMAGICAGLTGTYEGRGRQQMKSVVDVPMLGGLTMEVYTADLQAA